MFKLTIKTSTATTTVTVSRKPKVSDLPDAIGCPECGISIGHLSRCSLRPARSLAR